VKIHCSVLAEDAIKAAISDYKQKAASVIVMVQVTPKASRRSAKRFRREKVTGGLRLGVLGGGSGLSYQFKSTPSLAPPTRC